MESIKKTRKWIEKVVIGLGLCPFAAKVYFENKIHFEIGDIADPKYLLSKFKASIEIVIDAEFDTSIIVLKNGPEEFEDYLVLLDAFSAYLRENEIDNDIQLAGFHPKYQFEHTQPDDIENHTNRSPFPLIHILKVDDVAKAIESHPDIDSVPVNNIAVMKQIGIGGLEKLLEED